MLKVCYQILAMQNKFYFLRGRILGAVEIWAHYSIHIFIELTYMYMQSKSIQVGELNLDPEVELPSKKRYKLAVKILPRRLVLCPSPSHHL